ncbi:hypothetical protein GCK32_022350 [Trichostrongylus colubriformis]|uniref:Uncharacterized protein n=1 Tax=Trichostrongylus colubriformis TaxID=6319 RepID=A0AAN8EVZ1_TRICO
MDTPAAPPVQGRRGKKHRIDLSSPGSDMDLGRAIELVIGDPSIPPHLKAAMGGLMEMKEQMMSILAKNKELTTENETIRQRNFVSRTSPNQNLIPEPQCTVNNVDNDSLDHHPENGL